MGLLDILSPAGLGNPLELIDKAKDLFGSRPETSNERPTGNSIFDLLRGNPETKEKAEAIKENAEKERANVFLEISSSIYRRWFPNLAKFTDLAAAGAQAVGVREMGPEAVSWQHEFETITAFSLLTPDFILKPLIDPLATSELFKKMVDYWPTSIPDDMKADIKKANYDPDTFFDIIRIMNQDIAAGKTTVEDVLKLIPGGSLMGGGMLDRLRGLLGSSS